MSKHQADKSVLITGGSGSVGRALVESFCFNGYKVMFQYSANDLIAQDLCKSFGAQAIKVDFLEKLELPRTDFDIVINNLGINITDALTHEVSLSDWDRTLLLNVTVPFRIIQLCLPAMMKNCWGRIINISSIYGLRGVDKNLPYTVSKHGMSGMTKTVAKEYAQYGVTCNEICPGPIESEMMNRIGEREARVEGISLDEYFKEVCREIPAGRMAQPKNIAALAIFLASPAADYLNGASIPLDGGIIA